ncbi:hypothetical protein CPB83DRAFT_178693 [Crepidotus variabilis]|uniref:Uncharacterized protein n=1 Tax=Crepidotus variabilis TaxID=179855 RepID=A0A9P6EKA3_9AGAR|nr:hypothetical protein CPB83DRAFT_178693 [Crepidotus variabilis]
MGRALFSASHAATAPEPVIRTQSEPEVDSLKWSSFNRFDPDSEEFFQDAEFEAFIDLQHQRQSPLEGSINGSDSGESNENEQGSPMAVGSDDPAILIRGTYNPATRTWDANLDSTRSGAPVWMTGSLSPPYPASSASSSASTSPMQSPRLPQSPDQLANPPFIPPASFRAPSPAEGYLERLTDAQQILTSRHPLRITPISASRDQPLSPEGPLSPLLVGSPPIHVEVATTPRRQDAQAMMTPSPPPSATPRFYSWRHHHPIPAMPPSPTIIRGNSEGPLTNSRARLSYTRIESTSTRVRVPNIVM